MSDVTATLDKSAGAEKTAIPPKLDKNDEPKASPISPGTTGMEHLSTVLYRGPYKTSMGYSTGWREASRSEFHSGVIASLLTGFSSFSPARMVEVVELACHWSGDGREWCQPCVDENGTIYGFGFDFLPKIVKMKEEYAIRHPEVKAYFDDLMGRTEWKTFMKAVGAQDGTKEGLQAVDITVEPIKALLVEKFGDHVVIPPGVRLTDRPPTMDERIAAFRQATNFRGRVIEVTFPEPPAPSSVDAGAKSASS